MRLEQWHRTQTAVVVAKIVTILLFLSVCCMGCNRNSSPPAQEAFTSPAAADAEPRPAVTGAAGGKITLLVTAYHDRGLDGLRHKKGELERDWAHWRGEPDADVLAFVLEVEPPIVKEAELYRLIRDHAQKIEQNPGRSQRQWRQMSDSLCSYSFGNGPMETHRPVLKLLLLYAEIAGVRPTEIF